MNIAASSWVSMHIDIRLKDGSMAESTHNIGKPMRFQMGTDTFSKKLEEALLGLKAGDKKKVMLLPEDAFGEPHPANIYQIPKSRFTQVEKDCEPGTIVMFSHPSGSERPGIIREVQTNEVTIDFNHPLAGQVVLFDVEIITVE